MGRMRRITSLGTIEPKPIMRPRESIATTIHRQRQSPGPLSDGLPERLMHPPIAYVEVSKVATERLARSIGQTHDES